MWRKLQGLFLLFVFFTSIRTIRTFSQYGYEIKDLQETEFSLFQREAESWRIYDTISEKKVTKTLSFNGTPSEFILGGPDVLKSLKQTKTYLTLVCFERIYTGLPPHDFVTFIGKFWYFGAEYGFPVIVDMSMKSTSLDNTISSQTNKIKQDSPQEFRFDFMKVSSIHAEPTLYLIIQVQSALGFERQSFGFREITLHLSNYSASDTLVSCYVSEELSKDENSACPCPFGQTLDDNFICQNCSANCVNCFGIDPSQCMSCVSGTHWRGNECNNCHLNCKDCTGHSYHECSSCNFGFYDYGNGTCLETCELPFRAERDSEKWRCTKLCKPGQYFMEKRCIERCDSPLIKYHDENGILSCKSPCSDTKSFIYPNMSCGSFCPFPLKPEYLNTKKLCRNPCPSAADYLFLNGSCLKECPSPFRIQSESIANYCLNPCNQSENLYLYRNGSCHPSCHPPLKIREKHGIKYCKSQCDLKRDYILTDGSCSQECPFPLIQRMEGLFGTFCVSPCESADNFVLKNGSCLLNCPGFFDVKREYGAKYCIEPCLPDQFYFADPRSCLNECPAPLLKTKTEGANLCQNPCDKKFIYSDQSCHESCPAPLIIEEGNYCKSSCLKENEYLNQDGSCGETCEYPSKILRRGSYKICAIDISNTQATQSKRVIKLSKGLSEIGGIVISLINPGDPTSLFMIPLLEMFEIVKFADLPLPKDIEMLLSPKEIRENLDHSLQLLGITGGLCVLLIMILMRWNRSKIGELLSSKWNVFAPIIMSLSGKVTLYLLVGENGPFRSLLCLTVILLTIVIIIMAYRWRIAVETYKSAKLFLFVYVIRVTCVNLVIGYFSTSPGIQATLMMLLNFGMLFYLVYSSPIKKKICYVQHIMLETALLFYNFFLTILALYEFQNNKKIGESMEILYLVAHIATASIITVKLFQNLGDRIILNLNQIGRSEGSEDSEQQSHVAAAAADEIGTDSEGEDESMEAEVLVS